MAEAVLMPKSGISVESCIMGSWKKNVGDTVSIGDVLFDYETDKASFECESTAEGILLEIFYESGDEVEALKPVCAVGSEGEDVSAIRSEAGVGGSAAAKTPGGAGQSGAAQGTLPSGNASGSTAPTASMNESVQSASANKGVSPRGRNLAAKLGVDPSQASPSGPKGRVLAGDVEKLYGDRQSGIITEDANIGTPIPAVFDGEFGPEYRDEPMTKIRRVIAANMQASLANTSQLTHHHSFDATMLLTLRRVYKTEGEVKGLGGISIGDMILFAVSRTLPDFPYLNCHLLDGDVIRQWRDVHLGVAVDTPRGLMVPTVFSANRKTLKEISDEVKSLAEAARSGSISPDLLQGGTFTVSNLGPTGVEVFTPILNPPQVGIIGVCGAVTRVKQGPEGLSAYQSIGLSLTYDHRGVDGAPASRFAQQLVKNLENFPLLLTERS